MSDDIKENLDHIAKWDGVAWTQIHRIPGGAYRSKKQFAKTKGTGMGNRSKCIHEWDFTHEPQKIFCAKCCATLEGRQIINYLNKLERSEIKALKKRVQKLEHKLEALMK